MNKSLPLIALTFATGIASAQTFTGSTSSYLTWNRPEENGIFQPSAVSGVGTAAHFAAQTFTVPVTGNYTIISTATGGWDNTLFIFGGSFGASSPLVNVKFGNDDYNFTTGTAGFDSVNLKSGMTYVMVTSGFANFDGGEFVNTVAASTSGPLITGVVTLQDWTTTTAGQTVTIDLVTPGTQDIVATSVVTLDNSGTYSFHNTLSGSYDLYAKASHWLRRKLASVSISDVTDTLASFSLINGDIDGDNAVSILDYSALSTFFDKTDADADWLTENGDGTAPRDADLDGDNAVTILDYSILSNNFDVAGN